MDNPKYLWIQTRDGSPTLWSNEIGESFRSVKGAFIESWIAFVAPALGFAQKHLTQTPLIIGEFGLGPGTNWILLSVAAYKLGLKLEYHVIEKDLESFAMGKVRWAQELERISAFVDLELEKLAFKTTFPGPHKLDELSAPTVYASVEAAQASRLSANIWFHDPFGFDVNPEGYSISTLQNCAQLWQKKFWGGSYACNRHFKEALASLADVKSESILTGSKQLKRERLEFYRLDEANSLL